MFVCTRVCACVLIHTVQPIAWQLEGSWLFTRFPCCFKSQSLSSSTCPQLLSNCVWTCSCPFLSGSRRIDMDAYTGGNKANLCIFFLGLRSLSSSALALYVQFFWMNLSPRKCSCVFWGRRLFIHDVISRLQILVITTIIKIIKITIIHPSCKEHQIAERRSLQRRLSINCVWNFEFVGNEGRCSGSQFAIHFYYWVYTCRASPVWHK